MKNRYLILGATVLSVAWFTAGAVTMYATGTQYILERHSNSEKMSSYSDGFQAGKNTASSKYNDYYQDGYNSGYRAAKNTYKKEEIYNEDERVDSTGGFNYSGYTFYIKENVNVNGENYAGYSFNLNSTIFLETDRRPNRFEEMCNHEMLHQLFPSFDHPNGEAKYSDSIYYLQDKVDLSVCESVTLKAQKLNGNVSS